jgi:hypothetical protein
MQSDHLASDLDEIHKQLPATLAFPITGPADFKSKIAEGQYTFRNKPVDRVKAIEGIPADIFPIISMQDFDQKMLRLIAARDAIKHKTSAGKP